MFWLLALPIKGPTGTGSTRNRTWELLQEKTSYGQQLSSNFKLDVPELRIGTLDTLLALSDDLVKVSSAVEAVVAKIRRTVVDMAGPSAVATLKVENLPVDAYLTRFKWDEPKFPLRRPLRETVEKIGEIMSHIEDDLKVSARSTEQGKSTYQAMQSSTVAALFSLFWGQCSCHLYMQCARVHLPAHTHCLFVNQPTVNGRACVLCCTICTPSRSKWGSSTLSKAS